MNATINLHSSKSGSGFFLSKKMGHAIASISVFTCTSVKWELIATCPSLRTIRVYIFLTLYEWCFLKKKSTSFRAEGVDKYFLARLDTYLQISSIFEKRKFYFCCLLYVKLRKRIFLNLFHFHFRP